MSADRHAIKNALPLPVQDVFKSFYSVPTFQRPYVWKRTQVKSLIDDIRQEHKDDNGTATHYFLGSIVVYPGPSDAFELVDGQQRITTLYILFCALRDRIRAIDKHDPDVAYIEHCIAGVTAGPGGKSIFRPRVVVSHEPDALVLTKIGENQIAKLGLKPKDSGWHLLEAYRACMDYLIKEFDEDVDNLRGFALFLLTNVEMIKIITADFVRALVIFERINNRGMNLNALDLLKNLLFKKSGATEHKALAKRWESLIDVLRKGGEKNHMRFLRYYLFAHHDMAGDKVIKADDVFGWFDEKDKELKFSQNATAFVAKMENAATDYVHLIGGRGPGNRDVAALSGIAAQRIAVRQHIPVLLAGRQLPVADFKRLAEAMEALTMVFAITNAQWNELERVGPRWCRLLRELQDGRGTLDDFIRKEMKPVVDSKLTEAFKRLQDTEAMRPSLLKYLLAKVTQKVDAECGKSYPLDHYMLAQSTIEHILPQSLSSRALADGFESQEQAKPYVHRFGNLALLNHNANASASDDPFEMKRRKYERSEYELTRCLVTDIEVGAKTSFGRVAEKYGFRPFTTWSPLSVERRHSQMEQILREILGV